MKTCKKCATPLEENATFCGKCGEKVSAETSIENVPKKHGYLWNITHYGILEKPVKSKILKQTLIGGVILILLIILIPVIVAIAPKSSDKEKPESNTSGVISETESNTNTELNIKDSLVLDWDSTFKGQPKEFLGIVDNTLYFVLEDELYDSCLYSYNFDTKENKEIARYFQLSKGYHIAENYIIFFAAQDEKGEKIKLMSYNIKNNKTNVTPDLTYSDMGSEKTRDWNENEINLNVVVNDKLYFQLASVVYSLDLQQNVFDIIVDKTETHSEETSSGTSIPEFVTFDQFDKSHIYYTFNLRHTSDSNYYDEFNLYKYDIASKTKEKVVSLKTDNSSSENIQGLSVVNGNVFVQYDSGDIYQVSDNTETKVYAGPSVDLALENMLSEEAYSEIGTAFQEENAVLVINKAGIVSYTDYSTLDVSSLVDIKYGDMFYYATLEIEGKTVSGCWFYDHSRGEESINATLSYIPCAGRYIYSNYENVSDDKALVTSYFFVTKENFEDNPLYKDKVNDLPSGIYAVTSANFWLATSASE